MSLFYGIKTKERKHEIILRWDAFLSDSLQLLNPFGHCVQFILFGWAFGKFDWLWQMAEFKVFSKFANKLDISCWIIDRLKLTFTWIPYQISAKKKGKNHILDDMKMERSKKFATHNSFSNKLLITELPLANASSCLLHKINNGIEAVAASAKIVYK